MSNRDYIELAIYQLRGNGHEPLLVITASTEEDGVAAVGGFWNERVCDETRFRVICDYLGRKCKEVGILFPLKGVRKPDHRPPA